MFFARCFTAALVLLACHCLGDEAAPKAKKVLYLGIDGCRFDSIEKAETPNLDALMKSGIKSDHCLILGERYQKNDTISGPGWSSIYTGVWADKHGVQDNTFKGSNYKDYPHFFQRIREAQPKARLASFVTWTPIQKFIVSAADVNEADEDVIRRNYAISDTAAAAKAVKELAENDPTVVCYYIGNVDETGHKFGFHPSVPQYIAAIEEADKHVGEVLAAVKARKTYAQEQWLIVVTSDHGGKGTSHSSGHKIPEIYNSFLIVSGDAAQRGDFAEQVYLVDAVPTMLTFLGVKIDPEWNLDGKGVGLK
jgi:predicted AlkP superfamily pyrophosphatase or phosphodiesterase